MQSPPALDCAAAVVPIDAAPIRSPQAVHTALARRFAGKSVTEIGTRNGDGMACFARVARSAVAIEIEKAYCAKLTARAAALRTRREGDYSVACGSYVKKLAEAGALPEVVTWWQMWPRLTNDKVLANLRRLYAGRAARSTDSQAVVLFDMQWPYDRKSHTRLRPQMEWSEKVEFDERALCLNRSAVRAKDCNARARGTFVIAGIPITRAPAIAAPRPPAADLRHAVCLTGMEREFPHIAVNVREFLFRLLGTPNARITFFGVRPAADKWAAVQRMLPMHVVETQRGIGGTCLPHLATAEQRRSGNLKSFIYCSNHGRRDCYGGFPGELCSLAQCEDMISAHEREHGVSFHSVYRLRADLSMELPLRMPWPLPARTIFTPFMNDAGGVNDQAAFGEREAMRLYLTRFRHLVPNMSVAALQRGLPFRFHSSPRISTEEFLKATLHHDGVTAVRLRQWMYCTHTFKAFLDRAAVRGCISRLRYRTPCDALICPRANIKYWCTCHRHELGGNATCSSIAAGGPVGNAGHGENRALHRRDQALRRDLASCVHTQGQQLFMRSCSVTKASRGTQAWAAEVAVHRKKRPGCDDAGPCELRAAANATYISVASVPRCVYESETAGQGAPYVT